MKCSTVTFKGWAPTYESNRMMIEYTVSNRTRTVSVHVNKVAQDPPRERKVRVTVTIEDA